MCEGSVTVITVGSLPQWSRRGTAFIAHEVSTTRSVSALNAAMDVEVHRNISRPANLKVAAIAPASMAPTLPAEPVRE